MGGNIPLQVQMPQEEVMEALDVNVGVGVVEILRRKISKEVCNLHFAQSSMIVTHINPTKTTTTAIFDVDSKDANSDCDRGRIMKCLARCQQYHRLLITEVADLPPLRPILTNVAWFRSSLQGWTWLSHASLIFRPLHLGIPQPWGFI